MERGLIILTKFPFTDFSSLKRRPAIVLSNSMSSNEDFVLGYISSNILKSIRESDYLLMDDDPDFVQTGLLRSSVFKMNKIVTINRKLIIGEIGKASDRILKELNKRLKIVFNL